MGAVAIIIFEENGTLADIWTGHGTLVTIIIAVALIIIGATLISMIHGIETLTESHTELTYDYSLSETDLQNADLSGKELKEAVFSDSKLQGSNFSATNLKDVDFSGASLEYANFTNANLDDADLSNTTLVGARFSGANLNGTNFRQATLLEIDEPKSTFEQAKGIEDSIQPAHWD